MQPDAGQWRWGLELRGYGFDHQTRNLTGTARVTTAGARVTYAWDETVEEWFVNDQRGLEHGFTLKQRPAGVAGAGERIALWPPNHQYVTINVAQLVASANDNCSGNLTASVVIAQVSSDEPEDAPGSSDGSTLNDIVIAADCKSVQLRAERQDSSNGRVYTITFEVRDAAGNVATATAKVTVPKSQNGASAGDDGPSYMVLGGCP
ncbi:MAG TPA: hypothetical protein VFZ34_26525 [Blastocatellia bacterium]|nr:hypothetical protein [Blastocatellia bacterium]